MQKVFEDDKILYNCVFITENLNKIELLALTLTHSENPHSNFKEVFVVLNFSCSTFFCSSKYLD